MGVRHLDTFVRERVPGGCHPINIENEVRKYIQTASTANPPVPIIVVDLISLYSSMSQHDPKGVYFGGRFNLAYVAIDEFFGKLKGLGAQLVFFYDGPVQDEKSENWCKRQDERYTRRLDMLDAIESGTSVDVLMKKYEIPHNTLYPLKYIARQYGEFRLAISRECDQELAAFATRANALAIIADDSDFLIYEGSWKYWSCRELELSTLSTMELSRVALAKFLCLSSEQMPLFATLGGNDVMPYEVVRALHNLLGHSRDKFPNIARYIRELPKKPLAEKDIINILRRTTDGEPVTKDLVQRFQQSLDVYSVNIHPQNVNPTNDPTIKVLLEQDTPFLYQIWQGTPLDVSIGTVDMRRNDIGHHYSTLQVSLIQRMAAIILFHRKPQRPNHCPVIIKMSHQSPHREHSVPVQYPRCMDVPSLPVLMSKEPFMRKTLRKVKFQLLAWIASDTLEPEQLRQVPRKLRMTVLTVYFLLEQRAIELFEADAFLQVAHDVTYNTYDIRAVVYPETVSIRPFVLVFLFQKIYALVAKAVCLVSLEEANSFRNDPPFDGVLFHRLYDKWSKGQRILDDIKEWRIYDSLANDQ
ncbi:hypothetical protein RP20_CCG009346 [Aedes albopictus]|nr:hypothetical protein RP20_CCG009346 [Aedes albopictus]